MNGCKFNIVDDFEWTIDEQIEYHEKRIAELKAQKEKWKFTEDEKVILRNLPEEYKYIARDMNDELYVYIEKPIKNNTNWFVFGSFWLPIFEHIFQCIQWTDTEPCEFRKYI